MNYADYLLTNQPSVESLWMFDETGGTIARGQGRTPNNNATYSATGVTYRRPGPSAAIPYAVGLDGTAGVITLPAYFGPAATNGQRQSWEVWANDTVTRTLSSGPTTLIGSTDTNNTWPLRLGGNSTGSLTNEVAAIANDVDATGTRTGWTGFTIPAGWHHHVITYSSARNSWRYFKDGAEITLTAGTTKVAAGGGCAAFLGTATYTIGQVQGSVFSTWAGIAALAYYTIELSPLRIAANYTAGMGGARSHPPLHMLGA